DTEPRVLEVAGVLHQLGVEGGAQADIVGVEDEGAILAPRLKVTVGRLDGSRRAGLLVDDGIATGKAVVGEVDRTVARVDPVDEVVQGLSRGRVGTGLGRYCDVAVRPDR